METENFLDRTKSFLNGNSHVSSLRALPLMLIAAGALHAAAIFGPPTGTISSTAPGTTGGSITGTVTDFGQGLSLFGTATLQSTSAGANGLILDWTGSGSGTFFTSIQAADWNFIITGPGSSSSNWTLNFIMNPTLMTAVTPTITTYTGSVGSGGGPVSTTFAGINVPNGQTFTAYEVKLEVDTTFANSSDVLSVNVPSNSTIDIRPADIPEPGSVTLSAIGFAALLWAKARQKRAHR